MSQRLDAPAYLEHLRATGQLDSEPWPERLVLSMGHEPSAPARRRRGRRATPFGELRTHDSVGILMVRHVGGAAMAVLVDVLAHLDVREICVVGRAGGVGEGCALGSTYRVASVVASDGASLAYGAAGVMRLDDPLGSAVGHRSVRAVTIDAPFLVDDRLVAEWTRRDIELVDMELAAAAAVARRRGLSVGALFVCSDLRRVDSWEAAPPAEIAEALDGAVGEALAQLAVGEMS